MSNKTQLQTNNAKLEALITELQGKAAGGGSSVETCTVEIVIPKYSEIRAIHYVAFRNGETVSVVDDTDYLTAQTVTIENVVCRSTLVLMYTLYGQSSSWYDYVVSVSGGNKCLEEPGIYSSVYITASNNETATIVLNNEE